MNHTEDQSPLPLPGVLKEDLAVSSQKRDSPVNSHIVHIHADPILCNSVASTSFCTMHPNHSDKHSARINSNVSPPMVDGNSSCQYDSSDVLGLENSIPCSDSEEDRPGSFDYMPKQKGHVRISAAVNPSYDEEVKLDSSTASSVVESPRSDDGQAEEKADMTEQAKETRRKHKHNCWHYMPHCGQKSDDDDEEEEEDEEDTNDDEEEDGSGGLGDASIRSSVSSSFPRAASKEVDECVSYNLKPLNGPSAGQLNGPDVGPGHQLVMPLSYNLYQDRWMSEDNKEKEKKRGRSKDDTDKPEDPGQVDVNGNPRLLDPANYLQMRQWPRNKLDSTATGSPSSYTPLTISHSHAPSGADANAFDRKKERRRMKLERLKGTPAEEIKGHRKFNDIIEILAFVEGTNATKGDALKGDVSKGDASKADSKLGKKKPDRTRKKDHHSDGSHPLEDTVGAEDAPNKEESFVVTSVQPVARIMGNSFRRSFDESISKSLSEDEDVDKSNGEFHDCLNTYPEEFATANRDGPLKLNGSLLGIDKTSPKEADRLLALSAEDNKADRHLTDSVGKKSAKSKPKKDKPEGVGGDNGHLILKLNTVKQKVNSEVKDLLLVSSVPYVESVKSETAHTKEPPPDIKREDSFTEVKKKKKRPGVKDVHPPFPGHFSKSYNNSHAGGGTPNHRYQHRTSTPSPQPPVTLPAGTQIVTLPGGSQPHTPRDLSPSAFPVLSGQGQLLGLRPEARRNSCGDLNSLDSRTYDSDRESAKSLPVAHGTTASGDILPSYPLTYARIAAAPRKNDNTGVPSLDSSIASIPQNTSVNCSIPHSPGRSVLPQSSSNAAVTPERKATVWKGSPRERRHSIGSSPKDKIEDSKPTVAEKNRQCGSQEVLSKSTVSSAGKAAKHADVSPSKVRQAHAHDNSSSLPHTHAKLQTEAETPAETVAAEFTDCYTSLDTKPLSLTAGSTKTTEPNAGSPEYATSSSLSGTVDSPVPVALQPVISSQSVQASEAQKNMDSELIVRKSTPEASALALSAQSQTSPLANSKAVVNNQSRQNCPSTDAARKNPKKSVIFLDKRFDAAPPQNLGITFGFDSSYESSSDSAAHQPPFPSHHQPPPADVASTPSGFSAPLPPPTSTPSCQHFPAAAVSRGHPHIPPAAHTAAVSSTNSLHFTSSPAAVSSNLSKTVPKGPHIHGPCNGLIFHSKPTKRASEDQSQIIRDNNSKGGNRDRSSCSVNFHEIRTSSSSEEMDSILVSSGIHNKVPSVGSSALDQQDTSLPHAAIASQHTTCAHRNISEAPSPGADPAEVPREHSGLSLTSTQERPEVAASHPLGDLELGLRESGQDPSACAKEETVDALPSGAAAETASLQQQQNPGDSQPEHLRALTVVYGLKIKSGTGCGKLLFVPSSVSKKNRGSFEEVVGILRRRWLEEVTQMPGGESFVTLNNS